MSFAYSRNFAVVSLYLAYPPLPYALLKDKHSAGVCARVRMRVHMCGNVHVIRVSDFLSFYHDL